MWEEAIRQPMVIKAGDESAGSSSDALIEYIDVMPTILDYLGIPSPTDVQGQSFRGAINQPTAEFKEIAFSEYLEDNLAMVCTKAWKYVFTTGSRDLGIGYRTGIGPLGIVHRLYNLVDDPNEQHDVSRDPANADILQKLQQSMLQRFMETHPDAYKCPAELTLEGKLVWFCEPRDVGVDQSLEEVPVRVFPSE
jgi:choline-sulfatase